MDEEVQDPASQVRHLQRCINELVSLLALPAIWTGRESSHIIRTLLDAVLRALSLEFAYARLSRTFSPERIEVLRIAEDAKINLAPEELGRLLGDSFARQHEDASARGSNLFAIGSATAFSQSLGIQGEIGVLVVGSERAGFPSQTERLLLGVAANQASLGLHEASLLSAQKRLADELDRRVTERTKKLAETNAALQLQVGLLQHLPVSAWTLNPDGTPDFVNQVWLDFSGQTLEFIRSHPEAWMTAVHPEDREAASRVFRESVHAGKDFAFETRSLRAQDGTYRWHLQQAVVLRDVEGKVIKFVGTTTDIDDQKRAEEELRASEANLRRVIDTIPALSWCNLPDGPSEFLSKSWHEYTGISPAEARGWGWTAALHPDDLPPLMEKRRKMLALGQAYEIEARLRHHDGIYRWFLIRAQPFRDDSGKILRWYGAITDIEDRKTAEEALLASEQNLSLIINAMPVLAWSALSNGDVDFFNQRWLEYTGLSSEQAQGWGWAQAFHPDDLGRLNDRWLSAISSGRPLEIEARLRRMDGSYRWFLFRASPLRSSSGAIVKWYGTNTDIDDRKRAEEELHNTQAELGRVMRAMTMGQLTASIAHEVNQPLSGVVTNSGTCLRMLDASPPNLEGAREAVRRTLRDGKRASDVIARLRTLYSKAEPALEPMDLNEAVREVIPLSLGEVQRRSVILKQDLTDDLPLVVGDRVQLQQVVLNFLRNAADAMITIDDRPREVIVRTESVGDDQVRLSVKDSGIGLAPENTGRIFESFYTTKTDGMGIGLSVSRSIIEAHQGQIWATPNDGPGCTFSFSIPRAPHTFAGAKSVGV
jgi:PAS domain S-box-containing protein